MLNLGQAEGFRHLRGLGHGGDGRARAPDGRRRGSQGRRQQQRERGCTYFPLGPETCEGRAEMVGAGSTKHAR
eukprot:5822950-Pyramimonas_sp.AAC.1